MPSTCRARASSARAARGAGRRRSRARRRSGWPPSATRSGNDSASSSGARTSVGTGPAEPNAARSSSVRPRTASETTAITIAFRGPTFMNVCAARRSRRDSRDDELVLGERRSASGRRGSPSAATTRVPRTLASSTSRVRDEQRRQGVAGRRGGAEVPADRAAVPDLRRPDRARRLRERGQQAGERLLHRLRVGEPRAEPQRRRSRATSRAARAPRSGSGGRPAAAGRS